MKDDLIWNDLPFGLIFFEIGGNDEWMQGAPLRKIPEDHPKIDISSDTQEDGRRVITTVSKMVRPKRIPNVLQQLMVHIDETFHDYPPPFQRNMEVTVKEHVLNMITQGSVSKLLGPKRCREIMSYMSTPMFTWQKSFIEMWSFLLQRPIHDGQGNIITWNVECKDNAMVTITTKN